MGTLVDNEFQPSSYVHRIRHIFTRSVGESTPASSQCMNVTAVGDDGGISLVLGLDVAAFAVPAKKSYGRIDIVVKICFYRINSTKFVLYDCT